MHMESAKNLFTNPEEALDFDLETPVNSEGAVYSLEKIRNQAEKLGIIAAIHRNRFNISRAAKELKISRVTLYRLMKKHGFDGYS